MKKTSLILFAACLLLVLNSFGCDKTEEKPIIQEQTQIIPQEPVKRILTTKEAIALYPETPLYTENKDGKMIYADEVAKGDKLYVYYEGNQVDSKEAIRRLNNGTEDPFTFIHVSTEFSGDKNYWTRGLFIAQEHSVVAVVLDDAYIYNSPQTFDVTDKIIKQGDLVALKNDIDFSSAFTLVTIYNGANNGKEVYVKTNLLSTHPSDVIAVQTMNRLNAIEKPEPVVKNKLMTILNNMDISLIVSDFLFEGEK